MPASDLSRAVEALSCPAPARALSAELPQTLGQISERVESAWNPFGGFTWGPQPSAKVVLHGMPSPCAPSQPPKSLEESFAHVSGTSLNAAGSKWRFAGAAVTTTAIRRRPPRVLWVGAEAQLHARA